MPDGNVQLGVSLSPDLYVSNALLRTVLDKISTQIAERWVAENYQSVVEHISLEAIATMAAAQVSAEINKTLKEEAAVQVKEVVKREVWQRGLLGGMRRIR